MVEWGQLITASAAVVAAGIAAVAANWGNAHRHNATSDALDILDRLEGRQKEQWQRVVQGHIDTAERRSKGPSFMTRSLTLLLGGYVLLVLADVLTGTPVDRYLTMSVLAVLGLVLVLMGLVGVFIAAFFEVGLNAWLKRVRVSRDASGSHAEV